MHPDAFEIKPQKHKFVPVWKVILLLVPIASKVGLCTQRYIKDINRSSNFREVFKYGTTCLFAIMAVVNFKNSVNLSLSRLLCQSIPE